MVALVAANGAAILAVNFADVPGLGAGSYAWRESYSGTTGTGTAVSATLASHDMAIFKVFTSGTTTKTAASTTAKGTSFTSKVATSTTSVGSVVAIAGLARALVSVVRLAPTRMRTIHSAYEVLSSSICSVVEYNIKI